jgi:hypothetical protein
MLNGKTLGARLMSLLFAGSVVLISMTDVGHPSDALAGGSCVAWRQTGRCAADGPREPQNDKACNVAIDSGWSGFCDCDFGRVGVGCGHAQLSCNRVCASGSWTPPARSCVAWRQTGRCAADGPREPQNDKTCNVAIDSGWSGFCECSGGNVGVGCGHAVRNCTEVCASNGW